MCNKIGNVKEKQSVQQMLQNKWISIRWRINLDVLLILYTTLLSKQTEELNVEQECVQLPEDKKGGKLRDTHFNVISLGKYIKFGKFINFPEWTVALETQDCIKLQSFYTDEDTFTRVDRQGWDGEQFFVNCTSYG